MPARLSDWKAHVLHGCTVLPVAPRDTLSLQETQKTDPNSDGRERTARRGASLDKMILDFNVRDE